MFRRRRPTDEPLPPDAALDDLPDAPGQDEPAGGDSDPAGDSDQATTGAAGGAGEPYAVAVPQRPAGPWDIADVPDADAVPRADLGGILVPLPDGLEVRIEVEDETPVAVTLVDGDSQLQVQAYAAPKSGGLWEQVRREIGESLRADGGSAEDAAGPLGRELRAHVPVEGRSPQPARFFGVDGPRWFLRGLLTGAGATEPARARRLETAFGQVVVNRGSDAMAPRDMIALQLPREATATPPADAPTLQLPERGPEITETR